MKKFTLLLLMLFLSTSSKSQNNKRALLKEQLLNFKDEKYSGMNQKIEYFYNSKNQIFKIKNSAENFNWETLYEYRNDTIVREKSTRYNNKKLTPTKTITEYKYLNGKIHIEKFNKLHNDKYELQWYNKYNHTSNQILKKTFVPNKNKAENIAELNLNKEGKVVSLFNQSFPRESQVQYIFDNKADIHSYCMPEYLNGVIIFYAGNFKSLPHERHPKRFENSYNENGLLTKQQEYWKENLHCTRVLNYQ